MNIRNIDIFSPLIIIVVILSFVMLAEIGIQYNMMGLTPVSSITYIYIFYGIFIFFLGFLAAKFFEIYFFKKRDILTGFKSFFDIIDNSNHFNERIMVIFVLFPLVLQLINLYFSGSIPLFSGFLKARAFNTLTTFSYIIFLPSISILIAKFYNKKYFILVFFGVILFAATGYRATTLAIVISVLITTFYANGHKFKYFLILTPIILALGLLLGYIACISIEWQNWNVNPLSLIFIRAGYTLTVLDKIINMENPSHGLLTYYIISGFVKSVDPRLFLGQLLLHKELSITSTIFGPAILEFGYIGLAIQMFFLGLVLELLHYIQKIKKGIYTGFYAIGLAHTIVWVETGPMDLSVWIYYFLAVILMINGFIALNMSYNDRLSQRNILNK